MSAINWQKHFAEQKQSGLSVTAYRKKFGFTESQWYCAVKKIRKAQQINTPVSFARVKLKTIKCTLEIDGSTFHFDGTPENIAPILFSVLKGVA